jgi:hypothetical protein
VLSGRVLIAALTIAVVALPSVAGATQGIGGLAYSPNPIAAPGSLAANQAQDTTLTASGTAPGSVVSGATLWLKFETAPIGGATMICQAPLPGLPPLQKTVTNTALTDCIADGGGSIRVTYRAPGAPPAAGVDTITAQDAAAAPDHTTTTHYNYAQPVFTFSPSPIASAGSLAAGVTRTLTVTMKSSGGADMPNELVYAKVANPSDAAALGTAKVLTTDLTTAAQAFLTDAAAHLTISYQTPSPLPTGGGVDIVTVQNRASGPTSSATDTYTFPVLGATPSTTTPLAGSQFTMLVKATDGSGNTVPSYRGTIHFTSTDPAAALPADYTFTAGDAGAHSFNVTLHTAGSRAVDVTDGASTVSNPLTVSPGAAANILVVPAANPRALVPTTAALTIRDADGNTVTGYTGTVHLSSATDPVATLPTDYTFVPGDNGTTTLGLTWGTRGAQTLTARDTVTSTVTGSAAANVGAPPATSLRLTSPASTATAGALFDVSADALDSLSRVADSYRGTIHFTSTDAAATLPANFTFQASDAGTRDFTLLFGTAGPQTITIIDTVDGTLTAARNITVNVVVPGSVTLSQPSATERTGTFHFVSATVRDDVGNLVPDGTLVNFAVNGPTGGVVVDGFVTGMAAQPDGNGYWLVFSDGAVEEFGSAAWLGDAFNTASAPVVAMAPTASGNGYWLTDTAGKVYNFGDAGAFGNLGGVALNRPIVDIEPTATGNGYYLLADDGGVFTFGDAAFLGSTGGAHVGRFAVSITRNPVGTGYWITEDDGNVYPFGTAAILPDLNGLGSVVGLEAMPDGLGYWLIGDDGSVAAFGGAPDLGNASASTTNLPFAGMVRRPTGDGYWLVSGDGYVFGLGAAKNYGSPYSVPTVGGVAALGFVSFIPGVSDVTARVGSVTSSALRTTWLRPAGYRFAGADGSVYSFGGLTDRGSMAGKRLNAPIVGMASTPDGSGYWLLGRDGGVFSFAANFYGSTGAMRLNAPVVGMAATQSGQGYWFVAADGGIFSFGDARFYGSTGALRLNKPIVGMAPTPSGNGYWLVAADGGIFSFGDARFYGSTGALRLNSPIVGMASTETGKGYWFVAADGGIFNYGDAIFLGSKGASRLPGPIVGMTAMG